MAATELDDDAWLYGDDSEQCEYCNKMSTHVITLCAATKLNDHGDVNAGDAGR